MSTKELALATSREYEGLTRGDRALLEELRQNDLGARPEVWTDASVDWDRYDAVLVRSCWDYTEKPGEFEAWVRDLGERDVQLWNPPEVLLWNLRKNYLRELREMDLPVVPTVFLPPGSPALLEPILEEKRWDRAVVKPMIGAGSSGMYTVNSPVDPGGVERLGKLLEDGPGALVQPYLGTLEEHGEWSMFFFNQEYSYTVHKQPPEGEFRAHPDSGAGLEAVDPDPEWVRRAGRIVRAINKAWVYLRLDLVRGEEGPVIMEVEMIEPNLYLETVPEAVKEVAMTLREVVVEGNRPTQGRFELEQST